MKEHCYIISKCPVFELIGGARAENSNYSLPHLLVSVVLDNCNLEFDLNLTNLPSDDYGVLLK